MKGFLSQGRPTGGVCVCVSVCVCVCVFGRRNVFLFSLTNGFLIECPAKRLFVSVVVITAAQIGSADGDTN